MSEIQRRYLQLVAIFAAYALAIMVGVWIEHCIDKRGAKSQITQELPEKEQPEKEYWRSHIRAHFEELMLLGLEEHDCAISHFDSTFVEIGMKYNLDWRLMSAIAYTESRFRPFVVSYSGAVGLMQIMPRTGAIYGVGRDELFDPKVNIRVSAIHYRDIERMLSLPDNITHRDRVSLILASYNGGIGRVFDAQRLVRSEGGDPHLWSEVSKQLLNLRYPDYYNKSVVRLGRFGTARQTVYYVDSILKLYDQYREQTANCSYHQYPYASAYREE